MSIDIGRGRAQFDPSAATSQHTLEIHDLTTGEVIILDQCVTRRIMTETDMWSVTGVVRGSNRPCEFRMNTKDQVGLYTIT